MGGRAGERGADLWMPPGGYEEALDVVDADGARRLVKTIQKAPLMQGAPQKP